MASQVVDDVDLDWTGCLEKHPELLRLSEEYNSAILGVSVNKRGIPVVLYNSDVLHILFYEEMEGDEAYLEDYSKTQLCNQYVDNETYWGDQGGGAPLILEGKFDEDAVINHDPPCRFYKVNGTHWRGELIDEEDDYVEVDGD